MEWLDRYESAVRRHLPKSTRDDIAREIRSLLEEQIADREEAKGSRLDEQEVLALLKGFGHPLQVAARYGERRALISETLFPIYKQVMKYLLIIAFTVYAGLTIASAGGLADDWAGRAADEIGSIVIWYLIIITIGFHLLDGQLARINFFGKWNPAKLPADTQGLTPIPYFDTVVAILVNLVVFAIFASINNAYSWDALLGRSENPWAAFFLMCQIYLAASILLQLTLLYHPYWTRTRLVARATLAMCCALIMVYALTLNPIVTDAEGAETGRKVLRWLLATVFVPVLIASVIDFAYSIYRLAKPGRPTFPKVLGWLMATAFVPVFLSASVVVVFNVYHLMRPGTPAHELAAWLLGNPS